MTTVAETNAANGLLTGGAGPRNPKSILGKDDFLKLLVAQLKNQDPQSPMNADQMAAQLAQFSSVEQLTNISQALDKQQGLQSQLLSEVAAGSAVQTIGRSVTASSDIVRLGEGGTEALLVAGNGGPATVTVTDPVTGAVVATQFLGPLPNGRATFDVARTFAGVRDGTYRVRVTTPGSDGEPQELPVATRGIVSGLATTSAGLTYVVGGVRVPLSSVTEITTR
ncbi:MAG: hypothetical protein MUF40_01595 [Gemmatimonadaceae bacterium]|nr:hypothetical protein [Gemmatimonadaceae bacterium]